MKPAPKKKIVFDPNKEYTWKTEDIFEIDGQQFMMILGAVRSVLETPEAQKVQLALQAHGVIQSILAKAVEDGVATENVKEVPPLPPAK